jgi:hypothetical protein
MSDATTGEAHFGVQTIGARGEFVAAVLRAVECAIERSARSMLWVDGDFSEWPLEDAALLGALANWLRLPQRHLVLLATRFDDISRRRARFVAWHRAWSHAISAFSPAEADAKDLPTLLLVEGAAYVHLLDPAQWRGRLSFDSAQERLWRDNLDVVLQRSEAAFPATTLGL